MGLTKEAWAALKAIKSPRWVLSVLAVPNICEVCKGPLPKHDSDTFMRFCGDNCRNGRHNKKRMAA